MVKELTLLDICHNKTTNILDGRVKQVFNTHTDLDHKCKDTIVSVMFAHVPSDKLAEMLSLYEYFITLMFLKTKIYQ